MTIDCDGQLPSIGDRTKLRQIMTNLVSNSLKFTKEGHVKLMATRSSDCGWLVLEVEDTGPGVPPSMQQRMFTKSVIPQLPTGYTVSPSPLETATELPPTRVRPP